VIFNFVRVLLSFKGGVTNINILQLRCWRCFVFKMAVSEIQDCYVSLLQFCCAEIWLRVGALIVW